MAYTLTEYARDIVTAKGKPSGTATTSTVIPVIIIVTNFDACFVFQDSSFVLYVTTQNRMTITITVRAAITVP